MIPFENIYISLFLQPVMVIEKKSVDSGFTSNTNVAPPKRRGPVPSTKPNFASKGRPASKLEQKKNVRPQIPKQGSSKAPFGDPKKVGYKYVGKESWGAFLRKNLPKELIPTNRTGYILGIVFLVIVIIALIQFPLGELLSGNIEDLKVNVGVPWPFLVFDAFDPLEQPVQMKALIFDLIIYVAISYALEILINVVLYSEFMKSKKQKKIAPKVFKPRAGTLSEKVTNKIVGEGSSQKRVILGKKNDGKKFDSLTEVSKKIGKREVVAPDSRNKLY